MTALITGFQTRSQLDLRAARSVSHNIWPSKGGSAVHWGGGGRLGIPADHAGHMRCMQVWKAWQNYHMDGHGWADIAYTGGYCQHGYAMAGRGFGVRTAANGTNDSNDRYYAFVWVGCEDDGPPTPSAVSALEWWVAEARRAGGAGMDVQPHRALTSTDCPGDVLAIVAARLRAVPPILPPPPTPKPPPPPKPPGPVVIERGVPAPAFPLSHGQFFGPEGGGPDSVSGYHSHRGDLRKWQARMVHRGWILTPDGLYGPLGASTPTGETARVAKAAQRQWGLSVDGLIGPATWAAAWTRDITRP